MPKARAPLDYDRYQALQRQGLSQRQIAKELGIAESTLRDNLKMMQKAQASYGLPQDDQGLLQDDLGVPEGAPQEYL
jgi:transcriptional regulator with XRE-family HTH domain